MVLNEDLFLEYFEMTKDEYLRDMAQADWETGQLFSADDFNYFKHGCADDGYEVTEEDFQKYWEYIDECRANQFAEDSDEKADWELAGYEIMDEK